jgi:hypothetical protein
MTALEEIRKILLSRDQAPLCDGCIAILTGYDRSTVNQCCREVLSQETPDAYECIRAEQRCEICGYNLECTRLAVSCG